MEEKTRYIMINEDMVASRVDTNDVEVAIHVADRGYIVLIDLERMTQYDRGEWYPIH